MNFTYQNHLTYSIDDRMWGYRSNSFEKFKISVGTIDKDHYKKSNFREELRRTADLVYKDYGKNFALFLSGGTDSEIVARNFLDIGIKPTCYTVKFNNNYNLEDVNEATNLAKELNLKLNIIDFDIKNFVYSGEADHFGKSIQCSQVTYLMIYFNILKLGLPAIMGGELLITRNTLSKESFWYFTLRENEDCSAMRFSIKYNLPLVNEWFSYTPELMLFYLENGYIQNLVSNKYNHKLTSVSSKNEILKGLMPEIRVRKKTHGFENLLAFNFETYKNLLGNQIYRLETSIDGIEYSKVIKYLKNANKKIN